MTDVPGGEFRSRRGTLLVGPAGPGGGLRHRGYI